MFIYTKPHNIDTNIHGRRIVNLSQLPQLVILAQSNGGRVVFVITDGKSVNIAVKSTLEEAQAVVDRIFKAITEGKTFIDLQDEEAPEASKTTEQPQSAVDKVAGINYGSR